MTDPDDTPETAANPFRGAVATTSDLVECFGVTKAYVGKLATDGKLLKLDRDQWDAFESVRLFTEHLRTRKINQHDGGGDSPIEVGIQYEADKARKMKADADIAETLAGLVKGRVHEGIAVREVWMAQLMAARSKFLATPSKLAALLPPELAAQFLIEATDIVHEVLEQLSDYDPDKIAERTDKKRVLDPTRTADDAAVEAAPEAEFEPMGGFSATSAE